MKIYRRLLMMGGMKKRDLLLSLSSGLLLVLSFPHFDLEFLAWFALVPLLRAIEEKDLWTSFRLGFLTGFCSFLGILYWVIVAVHTYGYIPIVLSGLILLLLVVYLACYMGMFTWLLRWIQNRLGIKTVLFAPALWVTLEYVRSFLLTGFPWASLGHSQYLNLPFIQIADITGVYGLSFMILLVNATLYGMLQQWSTKRVSSREIAFTALLVLGVLIYGYGRIAALRQEISSLPSLRVGVVQGNIDQSIKWDASFQKETLKIYEKLSLRAGHDKPDLIIWPETATPFFFQDATEYHPFILSIPKRTQASLLFGSPSYKIEKGKPIHYNSAYLVSPTGELVGKYDKLHLVPFGEYVPLGDLIPLGSLGEGIGNFKPGDRIHLFSLPQGRFGVVICFEIIFPDLCRRFVREGAQFLVTITNDAWFGRTSAPYQHFSIATFRAVENRVFIARAANTGVSGFIDPTGRIIETGGIFTEETLTETIRLSTRKTFYTLYGDLFAWLSSAFTVAMILWGTLQRRRR